MSAPLPGLDALLELLRNDAPRVDRERTISDSTIENLRAMGLLSALGADCVPPRSAHSGDLGDLGDFFEKIVQLAGACPSTAWLVSLQGAAQWHAGFFEETIRDQVFSTPDLFVSATYMPRGRLVATSRGYRLSGSWRQAIGAEFANWFLLGCLVIGRTGDPIDYGVVLVPRDAVTLGDVWNASGLRGVGGREVLIDDLVLPAQQIYGMSEQSDDEARDQGLSPGMFRTPYWIVMGLAHSLPALGAAQGAYNYHLSRLASRSIISLPGGLGESKEEFDYQMVARGMTEIDAGLLQVRRDISELDAAGMAGHQRVSMELRLRARRNQVRACERAVEAIDLLMRAAGGHAVLEVSPLQRYWRDIHTAAAFLTNSADRIMVRYGRWAAGAEPAVSLPMGDQL